MLKLTLESSGASPPSNIFGGLMFGAVNHYDGLFSRDVRKLFVDASINRVEILDRETGDIELEWYLTLPYPTEICLGSRYSDALKRWRAIRDIQISSKKLIRVGQCISDDYIARFETMVKQQIIDAADEIRRVEKFGANGKCFSYTHILTLIFLLYFYLNLIYEFFMLLKLALKNVSTIISARKMTWRKLAEKCNMNESQMSQLRHRRTDAKLSTIERIASSLQIDPNKLFDDVSL